LTDFEVAGSRCYVICFYLC